MTIAVAIRKGNRLDDIIARYNPSIPEEPMALEVSPSGRYFQAVLQCCEKSLATIPYKNDFDSYLEYRRRFARESMPILRENILLPPEINTLLQLHLANGFNGAWEWNNFNWLFIRNLIQLSYDAGHNNFTLTIPEIADTDFVFNNVGKNLQGQEDRPLQLLVQGNLGNGFCRSTSYVRAQVQGNVKHGCGFSASYSQVSVNGNARNSFGGHAYASEFFLSGNCAKRWANLAQGSTYVFSGRKISQMGAHQSQGCTFKATNEKVLAVLNQIIEGQKVVHVHADGTEEEI